MVSLKNLGVTKRGTKSEEQTTERENEENKIQKQNKKPREQRMGNGVTDRARD